MSGPVRNFCVARGQLSANQAAVVFVVPAGHSLILRSVKLRRVETATTSALLDIYNRESNVSVSVLTTDFSQGGQYSWSDWVVLNDGDFLLAQSTGGSSFYWISGALLPYGAGQTSPAMTQSVASPPHHPPVDPGPPPTRVHTVP